MKAMIAGFRYPENEETIVLTLLGQGWERPVSEQDLDTAYTLFEQGGYDLLIVEWDNHPTRMNHRNCFDFLTKVQNILSWENPASPYRGREIQVVVYSADLDKSLARTALELGATSVIDPVSMATFLVKKVPSATRKKWQQEEVIKG
jgi:hypothetical protein